MTWCVGASLIVQVLLSYSSTMASPEVETFAMPTRGTVASARLGSLTSNTEKKCFNTTICFPSLHHVQCWWAAVVVRALAKHEANFSDDASLTVLLLTSQLCESLAYICFGSVSCPSLQLATQLLTRTLRSLSRAPAGGACTPAGGDKWHVRRRLFRHSMRFHVYKDPENRVFDFKYSEVCLL